LVARHVPMPLNHMQAVTPGEQASTSNNKEALFNAVATRRATGGRDMTKTQPLIDVHLAPAAGLG